MKIRSVGIAAIALLLPLSAAACGDSGDDKPDTGDVKSQLTKAGMPEEQADCIAKALDESGLTYDDYTSVSEDPTKVTSDPKFKKYVAAAVKCVAGDVSIPDMSIPDTGN